MHNITTTILLFVCNPGPLAAGAKSSQAAEDRWPDVWEALGWFHSKHGNCNVPTKYVMRQEDGCPVKLDGLKLGDKAQSMRRWKLYLDHKDQLDTIGFSFEKQKRGRVGLSLALLTRCLEYFGKSVGVKSGGKTYIPAGKLTPSPDWPEELKKVVWKSVVSRIRNGTAYLSARGEFGSVSIQLNANGLEKLAAYDLEQLADADKSTERTEKRLVMSARVTTATTTSASTGLASASSRSNPVSSTHLFTSSQNGKENQGQGIGEPPPYH